MLLLVLAPGLIRSYAQSNAVPLSANAGTASILSDNPVGLYTGTASVNVPVYTINVGSYALPVSLNYRSGGVKIADMASWCGTGWGLEAGGLVGRVVRGLQDEDNFFGFPDTTLLIQYDGSGYYTPFFTSLLNGGKDAEPDDYYFSMPGASGRLINGLPVPAQNIKLYPLDFSAHSFQELGVSGSINAYNGWYGYDGNGNKFEFNELEKTFSTTKNQSLTLTSPWGFYSRTDTTQKTVGAWWLSRIITEEGDTISFSYDTVVLEYDLPAITTMTNKMSGPGSALFNGNSKTIIKQKIASKRLRTITFSDGKVRFIPTTKQRADLIGDKALAKIVIENQRGEIVKQFVLNYDYMLSGVDAQQPQNVIKDYDSVVIGGTENNRYGNFDIAPASFYRRLFLRSMVEKDSSGKSLNLGYQFTYNRDIGLPARHTEQTDHWGYYNGFSGVTIEQKPDGSMDYIALAKRPNLIYTQQGAISKVRYPTGGYVAYMYANHYAKFPNSAGAFNTEDFAGGLCVTSVTKTDSATSKYPLVKNYYYYDGASAAIPYYKYSFTASLSGNLQVYSVLASQPTWPMTTTQGAYVGYGRVEEYQYAPASSIINGKTVSYFTNPMSKPDYVYSFTDPFSPSSPKVMANPPVNKADWKRGLLTEQKVFRYDSIAQDYVLRQHIVNTYDEVLTTSRTGAKAYLVFLEPNLAVPERKFIYYTYKETGGIALLSKTDEYNYDDKGDSLLVSEEYLYNKRNYLPRLITLSGSGYMGQELVNSLSYNYNPRHTSMLGNRVVENVNYRHGPGGNSFINGTLQHLDGNGKHAGTSQLKMRPPITMVSQFKFAMLPAGTNPLVDTMSAFQPDLRYTRVLKMERANTGNFPLQSRELEDGSKEYYVWGYTREHNKYLVAKIVTSDSIQFTVDQVLLDNGAFYSDQVVRAELNKLRTALPNAFVTTYTYSPLVGITSETNPYGETSYYQYDTHGRLVIERDKDYNVVKTYSYNNVGEESYSQVYYSIEKTGSFNRAGCSQPVPAVYTVKAGTYLSYLSQADADQKALNELNANGQKYANLTGTCVLFYNDTVSRKYFRNNCAGGVTGSEVVYAVAANKYSSVISKADADQQALNEVLANGQNHANTVGSCTVYRNEAQSQVFVRNNCTGAIGKAVTYSVAADTYSSSISTADANQKAWDDIWANGQNYANTNGGCVNPYMEMSLVYSYDDWLTGTSYFNLQVTFYDNQGGGVLVPLPFLPSGIPINYTLDVGYGDPYYGYIQTPYSTVTDGSGTQVLQTNIPVWGPDPVTGWFVRIVDMLYNQYLF